MSVENAGSAVVAGFDYPGAPSFPDPDPIYMLVWNQTISGTTVPVLADGFTAIWWCIPEAMQNAYWSGFFHAHFSEDGAWASGGADDPSIKRYCGMHPFPVPDSSTATRNLWEISANGGDYYDDNSGSANYSRITQYGRKYLQAMRATPNGSGGVLYRYYFDIPSDLSAIGPLMDTSGDVDSLTDPTAANRAIIQGDAPWNRGHEVYNGVHSLPTMYAADIGTAGILAALADPYDASIVGDLWYENRFPTSVEDISDKSGNGNDPAWFNANRPTLYTEA